MKIRDRIKELRRVKASTLVPNPSNWRVHPTSQAAALKTLLSEIGYASAVLVRELPDNSLMLIDGHLRADVAAQDEIPVLVLDVTEDEANKLLATLDPLSIMAEADAAKLDALWQSVELVDGAVAQLLSELATASNTDGQQTERSTPAHDSQYPITPIPGEQYDYALILCTNESDFAALQTLLGLEHKKSYKSRKVGLGRVVLFSQFMEIINAARGSVPQQPAS